MNGTLSMDRHLAAFLKALSFKHAFNSRARNIDLLNAVNPIERQVRHILPDTGQSRDIGHCTRKSSDRRRNNVLLTGTSSTDRNNNTGPV